MNANDHPGEFLRGSRVNENEDNDLLRWNWLPAWLLEKARARAKRDKISLREFLIRCVEHELE